MSYEIINSAQVTPHRLHSYARLVSRLHNPRHIDLANLLQPDSLTDNKVAADNVFRAARYSRLVDEEPGTKIIKLLVDPDQIESVAGFRRHMQGALLSVTNDTEPNYLLNIFAAWYAVQNERVLYDDPDNFHVNFNKELFPTDEGRQFNQDKLRPWKRWMPFLGLCSRMRFGPRAEFLVPNAFHRILPLMSEILPADGSYVDLASVISQIAARCPELDGGQLYEQAWSASRKDEMRSSLSLMISSALRQLHDTRQVELIRRADAGQNITLYRAEGHSLQQVTHIRLRAN